ncbi:hypothetical protein Rsub_08963 [Raphidocelis subcapitata]|uniref:CTLH domain-containing protein n=1 Tax=Raphidocelis subcapitata TaxID=307507 RepID=A0A2V0PFV6_9CHLO|nr:hypothetical protein Rsub_08963 [Raphidocelis subcapitata]|eukprot:GBF96087.1 hypothetical protein Rsub_08963 [Raphidocelis subcapitata]
MSLEIEATDVIKIILQFCKENGLTESFNAIQSECQVSLNTVDSIEGFVADVTNGRWEALLPAVAGLKLPRRKLEDLYEQVVLEMIELREVDTARAMLRQTQVLSRMKVDDPERWARMEGLCANKDKRRGALAHALSQEVVMVPPSRLLALVGQALQWQRSQGQLPPGTSFDLFRGTATSARDEVEAHPSQLAAKVTFGSKAHPECAAFSPDGTMLVTGSVDGFIEVWDPISGKLKKDLQYQADETFMMHDEAVLALGFSRDNELLVSGSQDGRIKVWRLRSGQCLRKFDAAHSQGVTSVALSRDGSQVLSSSFDGTVRVHGIKSGRALKEFRGHTSYVNGAIFSADGSQVISCSSDGTVRKNGTCPWLRPPQAAGGQDLAVNCVLPNPLSPDQLFVCDRSSSLYVTTMQGQVVSALHSGKKEGGAFLAAALSPRGEWAYALGEDGVLYCFSTAGGKLEHILQAHDKGAIGLAHHPHRNVVATFASEGPLMIWKA